ncbi:hypothetical protein BH09PAT2_BH09PAT2_02250 [soil metagenome]
MKNKLVIAGHICHDLPEPGKLGGASSFAAAAAGMQINGDLDITVVTRAPEGHPRMDDLHDLSDQYGFYVVNLANREVGYSGRITAFDNVYDKEGNRTQKQPDAASGYTAEDARIIGGLLEDADNSALLVGSVSRNEVSTEFLQTIGNVRAKNSTKVVLLPQGLVRRVHSDTKSVTHDSEALPWKNDDGLLRHATDLVVLSEEDLHGMPTGYEGFLAQTCNSMIVTRGKHGGTIYKDGQRIDQPAFQLTNQEIVEGNWTGSGDTVSTIMLLRHLEGKSLPHAFAEAQLYTAAKISSGLYGAKDGLASLPNAEQFQQFLKDRSDRVQQFVEDVYKSTKVELKFEAEGQLPYQTRK